MNIVQLQEQLKNFSQDQLVREMQMPSGTAPQFLVLGEIMRRQKMQQDFSTQQAKGQSQSTVAEDAIAAAGVPQGGVASMARALAPQTDMAESTGVQAMAMGGPVKKMQRGGAAMTDPAIRAMANRMGMSVEEYLRSVGEEQAARIEESAAARALRERMTGMEPSEGLMSLPTQADLDRRSQEDRFGFAASRPLAAPAIDTAMPAIPQMEARVLGRGMAAPGLPALAAMAESQPTVGAGYAVRPRGPSFEDVGRNIGAASALDMANTAAALTPAPIEEVVQEPPVRPGFGRAVKGLENGAPGFSEAWEFLTRPVDLTPEGQARAAEEEAKAAAAEGPAFERKGRGSPTLDELLTEEQAARVAAAQEQPTQPAADTTPSGGGTGSGGTGTGGIAGVGGMSSYEQELMDMLQRREKAAEQDKWLALAQVGLNMMSSTQPTLLGAIGEAGVKGVEAARTARDQYDKDRLELLGAIEQSRQSRAAAAARAARGASSGGISGGLGGLKLKDFLTQVSADIERLDTILNDPMTANAALTPEQELERRDLANKRDQLVAFREQLLYGAPVAMPEDDTTLDAADE